ncbi:GTP-binding protein [Dactylosporangium siamense]|uniref:Urease accessory protein UreG n=1 Tax=Dactylosporangium siamense TaxID=685454 RepID=A0A919PIQ7_9ACTN|nr:GTP-binding protein [Dactylosporangium siamense]GIG44654.1 urease accessory protein UreG [Dactylosporangium siamense]
MKTICRIGVGGPVGSGKTALIEELVPRLVQRHLKVLVVTGDAVSTEDADHVRRALKGILAEDRIAGVPAAVRRDAVEDLESRFPDTDVVLIENGAADFVVHVIDVAAGDRIPRKNGPGISRSDILVVNKTDLAPYVDADLGVMAADAAVQRGGKPVVFTNCRTGFGIPELTERILEGALFDVGVRV